MKHKRARFANVGVAGIGILAGLAMVLMTSIPASAATSLSGPINLGSATSFSVLGGASVTNTGGSVLGADLGVSPGTSITGFPPGTTLGTVHATDQVAADAQASLTTAYNVAASLTPTQSGLIDLGGRSLTPGVYSGGALSINSALTLAGSAESVWVFQAASTLITATGSSIILTGGASACNVFWQVGSSATLAGGSSFVGTVLADQSITANTGASITGRLLASVGSVTLDTNTITAPTGCADASGSVVRTSPTIVSGTPTSATRNTPYSFQVTATGGAPSSYSISSGALPTGLTLNSSTGLISGTPTTSGVFAFTVTAANGGPPDFSASYSITVVPVLAATGADPATTALLATAFSALGVAMLALRRRTSLR